MSCSFLVVVDVIDAVSDRPPPSQDCESSTNQTTSAPSNQHLPRSTSSPIDRVIAFARAGVEATTSKAALVTGRPARNAETV
jgi:hypothetical protein